MGIFDRFFVKNEPKEKVAKVMTIDQAIAELKKSPKIEEFGPTFVRIRKTKSEVLSSLEDLRAKGFKDDVDQRLKNMIDGTRNAFYNKVYPIVDKIGENADDLSKANDVYATIIEAVSEVNKNMQKYADKISFGFDKELGAFSNKMSDFNKIIDAMKIKLEDKNKVDKRRTKNLEVLEDYIRSKKKIETMKLDIESLDKRIRVSEKKLSQTVSAIDMLNVDERMKQGISVKSELKQVEKDIENIRKQAHSLYLDIEKPLRSYKARVNNTSMAKTIDLFSEEPLELLSRQKECETMSDILKNLEKQIRAGEMGLNEKRKNKALKALDKIKVSVLSYRYQALMKSKIQKSKLLDTIGYEKQKVMLTTKSSDIEGHINSLRNQLENMNRALEERKATSKKLRMQTTAILGEISEKSPETGQ